MTDGGFLPGHPVKLTIDGNPVTTLTASSAGTVGYTLSPSALGLSIGRHVLTLQSMLITPTAISRAGEPEGRPASGSA